MEIAKMSKAVAVHKTAPPSKVEPESFVAMLERVARDPSIDISRMQALLEMKERLDKRDAEIAFNRAMNAAQEAMPRVLRDAKADRYKYATLESIGKKIDPIISKHGFAQSFGTDKSELPNHYGVTCKLTHTGGHAELYRADVPTDLAGAKGAVTKNATQAFGSTMSYGRRYLTLLIFNIKLTNEDDDGQAAGGSETISDAQVEQLKDLLVEIGADSGLTTKFLKYMKVEKFSDIRERDFPRAVQALENKRPKGDTQERAYADR